MENPSTAGLKEGNRSISSPLAITIPRYTVHVNPAIVTSSPQLKRQAITQTALDVIVEYDGTTVGDVLLASVPSEPTTVSLPGYGFLTLGTLSPIPLTVDAGLSASQANSPVAVSETSLGTATGSPTISTSLMSSSTSFPVMSAGFANGTQFSNFTIAAAMNSTSALVTSTTSLMSSSSSSFSTSSTSMTAVASTSTFAGPVAGGGAPSAGSPTSSPTPTPASSDTNGTSPGTIAGGVVGGVAGALLLVGVVLLALRYFRSKDNGARLTDGEDGVSTAPVSRDGPPPSSGGPMAQRSAATPFAGLLARGRQSAGSSAPAAPSERGFQRVAGRKLTPVIHSGGDGFTEPVVARPIPAAVAPNLSRDFSAGTFLRDSNSTANTGPPDTQIPGEQFVTPGTVAGTSAAVTYRPGMAPSSMSSIRAAPSTSARNSDILAADRSAALRQERYFSGSPDSFDEQNAANIDPFRDPSPEAIYQQGPQRTPVVARLAGDGLGRSRPSQDGSRPSRFSEAL